MSVDPVGTGSEMGHGKSKPNRYVERSPKMRNFHRCHCLPKFIKYEKTPKTCRLGSDRLPLSIQRVKIRVL